MKKILSILLLSFSFSIIAMSQDIITDASLSDDDISLGEEVEIEFVVNEITDCDSYSIDVEIDYSFMEIVVTVDYDYDDSCDEEGDENSESVTLLPLLEGTYEVTIECDVAFNFDLDEEIDLSDVEVGSPDGGDCDASFVPSFFGFCPFYGDEVCACNGHNYDNECEAYFEEEYGLYYHFSCGDYVEENSVEFDCNYYRLDIENTFVEYDCSENSFEGDELYLEYTHENSGDSLLIFFNSSDSNVRLFLTEIYFGDIDCIAVSDNSKLEVANLNKGTYYIIADSEYGFYSTVEICDVSSNVNVLNQNYLKVFPNPNNSTFWIKSEKNIKNVIIFDIVGTEKFKRQFNQKEIKMNHDLESGIYLLQIETESGIVTRKLIIE